MLTSNSYAAENDPEFSILLPPPLEGGSYRLRPPHLIYKVIGRNPGLCACDTSTLPTALRRSQSNMCNIKSFWDWSSPLRQGEISISEEKKKPARIQTVLGPTPISSDNKIKWPLYGLME